MGFFSDMAREIGGVAGNVVGGITGWTAEMLAAAIGMPIEAVKAALRAGCQTHDEVRRWVRENWTDPDM